MNPVERIARALGAARDANLVGTVLEVDGPALKVRTVRGIVTAKSVDATAYRAGDEVLVRDGIVQGRVKRAEEVPVYFV